MVFGAVVDLAHCGVSVVNFFVVVRAVEGREDQVVAQGRVALAPLTLDIFSVVDENVVLGAFKGVAVDFRGGLQRIKIGASWRAV